MPPRFSALNIAMTMLASSRDALAGTSGSLDLAPFRRRTVGASARSRLKILARGSKERATGPASKHRGGHAELAPECVAEVTVIRVPEVEGQARQVPRPLGEPLEPRAQTTAVEVAPQGQSRGAMEGA